MPPSLSKAWLRICAYSPVLTILGRWVACCMEKSMFTFTLVRPISPLFVVIRITPEEARGPYNALAAASFRILTDSTVLASSVFISNNGAGIPSSTTKGELPFMEFRPRIYIVVASSAGVLVDWIEVNPAKRPVSVAENPLLGVLTNSSP